MFSCEWEGWRPGCRCTSRVCNYPLEPDPFRCQSESGEQKARDALENFAELIGGPFSRLSADAAIQWRMRRTSRRIFL